MPGLSLLLRLIPPVDEQTQTAEIAPLQAGRRKSTSALVIQLVVVLGNEQPAALGFPELRGRCVCVCVGAKRLTCCQGKQQPV